jgi:hypothetical protein
VSKYFTALPVGALRFGGAWIVGLSKTENKIDLHLQKARLGNKPSGLFYNQRGV